MRIVLFLFSLCTGLYAQWQQIPQLMATTNAAPQTAKIVQTHPDQLALFWRTAGDQDGALYMQRFDYDGYLYDSAPGNPTTTLPATPREYCIDSNNQGEHFVLWRDIRQGFSGDLYAQLIDAQGQILWQPDGKEWIKAPKKQSAPQCHWLDADTLICSWVDEPDSLVTMAFDRQGNPCWTRPIKVFLGPHNTLYHQCVTEDKKITLVWRSKAPDQHLYAMRLNTRADTLGIWSLTKFPEANPEINYISVETRGSRTWVCWSEKISTMDRLYLNILDDRGPLLNSPSLASGTRIGSLHTTLTGDDLWVSYADEADKGSLYLEKFDSTANRLVHRGIMHSQEYSIYPYSLDAHRVSDNGCLLFWQDSLSKVMRYDDTGDPLWHPTTGWILPPNSDYQTSAPDELGGVIMILLHNGLLYGQRLSPQGYPGVPTGIEQAKHHAIEKFSCYPNPFTDNLTIPLPPRTGTVRVNIYNILGQRIRHWTISDSRTSIEWDGLLMNQRRALPGVYLVEIQWQDEKKTSSVLLHD
jgi:hypothetical protein